MTFEEEMVRFFKGVARDKLHMVESSPEFQKAVKRQNVVKAQEVASKIIYGQRLSRRKDSD